MVTHQNFTNFLRILLLPPKSVQSFLEATKIYMKVGGYGKIEFRFFFCGRVKFDKFFLKLCKCYIHRLKLLFYGKFGLFRIDIKLVKG